MKHINIRGVLLMALPLLIGLWFNPVCPGAEAQKESPTPKLIAIRQDASPKEWLAANEVRRYVYLRTGTLLPVQRGAKEGAS